MQATIFPARNPGDIPAVRELFLEYAAWLKVDLCFQGFDAELAGLPGDYTAPAGALFIAKSEGVAAGCIALRRLEGQTGEIKRLYVRPAFRGTGLGERLAVRILDAARASGYRRLVLDTFDTMQAAVRLYSKLGFRPIPAYYNNPMGGALYFGLELTA